MDEREADFQCDVCGTNFSRITERESYPCPVCENEAPLADDADSLLVED